MIVHHDPGRCEGAPADPIVAAGGSLSANSEIPEMARALAECVGNIDADRLERAIVAGCIYADAIVLCDDIIDYAACRPALTRDVPRTGAYFLDAAMIWTELFPPQDGFWAALRRYHREYLGAMQLEGEISLGERTWESCDEALCRGIVRGKNGPVRGIAAFVAALGRNPAVLGDLETLTLDYFAVNQMLDDVRDWREDVRDGNISLVLRRASPHKPTLDDSRSIGIRMFGGGHVDYVLELACQQLLELRGLARRLGATRYAALVDRRLVQFSGLAAQLRADLVLQGRNANGAAGS
jgi:hypothetical protein